MKPQEFEAIVKAKTPLVESAPEPIVEATPAPVLKSMDITSINQQYHALLGESSLRGFAPGENGGGTEAYTMEDEELDGMALGELQAIAQAAKKIFASVKQGVPLEAWMYKKITNGNEGLTAVAQQINNPAVREQPGVAEGAPIVVMPSHKRLEKKHKPSLSRGMDPAKAQGEQDARDGKPYNNPYPFKKELGAPGNWEHNSYTASYDSVKKGVAEATGDPKFDRMMGKLTDPKNVKDNVPHHDYSNKLQSITPQQRAALAAHALTQRNIIENDEYVIGMLLDKLIGGRVGRDPYDQHSWDFKGEELETPAGNYYNWNSEGSGSSAEFYYVDSHHKPQSFFMDYDMNRGGFDLGGIHYPTDSNIPELAIEFGHEHPEFKPHIKGPLDDLDEQGVAEGSLEELANTSLKVKEPKDMYNVNDRKQTTYKIFKFKSGKNTFLINFTVKSPPTYGKKQNWNAVIVSFGVKEKQDDYSFGDEMNTDLTGKNKNQFLIYSTVINTIRRFITEYNTEIDEIIMQGAGERQEAMYQRFFQSAGKYFPGWHYDGKHSLVRDVPRQKVKKVREQGVAEGLEDTQKKIEDTINKLEDRLKHAKTDEQWDRISARIERLQAGLKRSKQGVAEGSIEKTATGLKHHGEFPDYPREKGVEFQKDPNRLNKSMTGRLDKAFDVHWQKVKKVREQGVAEGFPDDILAMAKKVSPNARTRGSRDEEIARRDAMLAQREKDRMHAPEPKGVSANERASLEAELQQLMPKYDRHYQMIDNYTQHMQAKHIADRVHEIQRKLKPGVAEGDNLTEFDPNEYSERYTVYMNREKIESFPDLEQAVEYVSDILEDEPNAYMFVWEIIDIDGKKVWEMDSHDYVKKNKITIGGKDVGGMLGGLLGVAEGWDPEDDEQWSAEDPKDEMYGVGDAYKRGIQDYRKFMQTKAKPSNPYSYTKQARQADNWEKGFEDGRYKQGMSEIKDPNDSRWSQKYNKDLPESTDYASAVNNLLNEFAGGMGVSSVAVGPGAMKNPAKTGSLFGGSYTQKNSPFKKKATKKESVMKR